MPGVSSLCGGARIRKKDSKGRGAVNEPVQTAIADQVREELYSAYFYLSAASYFESSSLTGFATWMRQQSQEEIAHEMKFFDQRGL
jgi:ferritin